MKILILSSSKHLYSTKRLVEAAKNKGYKVEVVNPAHCFMNIANGEMEVHHKLKKLNSYDAVIPRIGASISSYGMALVRQFESIGVYCLNSSNAIGRSRDKLRSMQLLCNKGLPLPKTSFANTTDQTEKILDFIGGTPAVIKLLEGSQGRGVVLAENQNAAQSVIDAFREVKVNFLVQEFIKDAQGNDIRCFVIGEKVVATMMRKAKEGEFRSNIHRGAVGIRVKITPEERKIAVSAARAMKLNVAGVDIIRSGSGPKILEVNSSPGLEGIEGVTELGIAEYIIEYIEKNYKYLKQDS